MKYQAVIFDLDGVICFTDEYHYLAWKALADRLGISVAYRPSTPCMATRLPYGTPLDYEVLKKIEDGEEILRRRIGGNVRLRLHGDVVRIEADRERFQEVIRQAGELAAELKRLGFVYVTLDLEGFRSGSMDVGVPAGIEVKK